MGARGSRESGIVPREIAGQRGRRAVIESTWERIYRPALRVAIGLCRRFLSKRGRARALNTCVASARTPPDPPFVRGGNRKRPAPLDPPLTKGGSGGVETTARPRGRTTYAIHSLSALAHDQRSLWRPIVPPSIACRALGRSRRKIDVSGLAPAPIMMGEAGPVCCGADLREWRAHAEGSGRNPSRVHRGDHGGPLGRPAPGTVRRPGRRRGVRADRGTSRGDGPIGLSIDARRPRRLGCRGRVPGHVPGAGPPGRLVPLAWLAGGLAVPGGAPGRAAGTRGGIATAVKRARRGHPARGRAPERPRPR